MNISPFFTGEMRGRMIASASRNFASTSAGKFMLPSVFN
jgi:hypothetical protein